MPQLVVHIRKEGAVRPQPAYAVWFSDTAVSVRPFAPEWEEAAGQVEAMLRSRGLGQGHGAFASAEARPSTLDGRPESRVERKGLRRRLKAGHV